MSVVYELWSFLLYDVFQGNEFYFYFACKMARRLGPILGNIWSQKVNLNVQKVILSMVNWGIGRWFKECLVEWSLMFLFWNWPLVFLHYVLHVHRVSQRLFQKICAPPPTPAQKGKIFLIFCRPPTLVEFCPETSRPSRNKISLSIYPSWIFSSAWLCQQSYCHGAVVRRPSSVVRPSSVRKLKFLRNRCMDSDQILWEATYLPYPQTIFLFFQNFQFSNFYEFFRFR